MQRRRRPEAAWRTDSTNASRVQGAGSCSPGAGPVHLQLRRLQHERHDQRHQRRTWTPPSRAYRSRSRIFLLVMAALMIPGGKLTDRYGRKRCFTAGLVLYGIGALLSAVVARPGRAHPRQLDPRGRRHGAADPARLHPHHAAVHRRHLAGPGVRRDQRDGRHRRRRRPADRRPHHLGDQLAGGLRLPGAGHRGDRLAEPPASTTRCPPTRPAPSTPAARSCRPSASSCSSPGILAADNNLWLMLA